ncbi:ABC-type branched-subunit amino acid transport system substrate-binding protein [Hydrogenophaga palleronii]|uniref:ABC-type branched-subunit amino acid transport system substrate-binding protein n=1 Tax=Hydrogenophaga palleronii TaxID=65655 RepID=A0ABU1WT06_9BURK|nr:ABC transporter substrate-binding protein [Hydrogenophaga palleronii]MDR7152411.1 ABC-type branched-subunit amino acid transport system substrate-binding protein [Hydrogenophaga palleronii]
MYKRLLRPTALVITLGASVLLGATSPAWAQLRIGQPSGFTGSVAAGVKENTEGAKLYIDAVNARGGVNGQKIELISVDDKFDPTVTVEVARDLITNQKVLALFLNRGTPHSQALLPLLAEFKVPLVGPSTGAMALHEPVNPWVFNVRATYQREAAKAIEHLATTGITRIAVLQTDDSFGADSAAGALKGFEAVGQKPLLLEKFPRDKPDFTGLATQVAKSGAQAVMVIGSAGNTANAVKAIRAAGSRAQAVTLSNNASEGFIKLLGDHARGVIVTQVFPNERSVSYALIKEAQELAKAAGMEGVSPAMMEGYAAAKVLTEGLRRAGPNPTPVALRNALESIKDYDMGGLKLSYSPTNHTGLDFSDLSIIDADGKFRR